MEMIDRKSRLRPAPGGCSIGHKDITAGTLGMVVRKSGERYILSNNHVLANINKGEIGDACYQPGPYDGGTAADEIARLWEFIPIEKSGWSPSDCSGSKFVADVFNFFARILRRKTRLFPVVLSDKENIVDCALAKPNNDEDVLDTILEVGELEGMIEPEVGMKVKKSGRTTGLTHGEITATEATVNVYLDDGAGIFADQIVMSPMCEGGDSGAIILTEDNKVVGFLCAGSDQTTIANKFSNVAQELGLDRGG